MAKKPRKKDDPVSGTARPEQWLTSLFGGGPTVAGISVGPDRAMGNPAVQRCVMTLSEDVGRMEPVLYQGTPRGKTRKEVTDHPASQVLGYRPNEWMSPFDYWRFHQMCYLLDGNHYDFMERNEDGQLISLIPIPPNRVSLWMATDGSLFYSVARGNMHEAAMLQKAPLLIPAEYILHDRGPSRDGLHGLSPIGWARESVGLALAGEDHASRTFSQGARPSGVLQHPKKMAPDVKLRLKTDFEEYRGQGGTMKTILLEDGLTFNPVTMSNLDVQFIESRKFQVEEIGRMFDMPHHKLGVVAPGGRGASMEELEQAYVNSTLLRHLERIESVINRFVLTANERGKFFFEYDLTRILRGDLKKRYEAYAIARQWGWFSVNDVLQLENRNPVKNGDERLQPVNMVPLGTPPKLLAGPTDGAPGTTAPGTQPPGADGPPVPPASGPQDGGTGDSDNKSNGHTEWP